MQNSSKAINTNYNDKDKIEKVIYFFDCKFNSSEYIICLSVVFVFQRKMHVILPKVSIIFLT